MGFISPGVSINRSRKRQKLFYDAYLSNLRATKRCVLDHKGGDRRTLDHLPTEILQLIFVYSHNFELPLVCRRFSLILRNSLYLQLAVLSELFQHAPSPCGSIFDRRFVTKPLLKLALKERCIGSNFIIEPLSEMFALPPYTVDKLSLFEYLLVLGGSPVNPCRSAFALAESFYADPIDHPDENELQYDLEPVAKDVYQLAFGRKKPTIRQRTMALLMKYGSDLDLDPEVVDMLFSSDQYELVEYGMTLGYVDPLDPALWENAAYRGDDRALEFLYTRRSWV